MDFFISDHHFNHNNIIKYACRDFKSVKDMNKYMIQQWNSVVSNNDTVFHLGDFSFNLSDQEIKLLLEQLNGNIVLIRGNHDRIGKKRLLDIGFKDVFNKYIYNNKYILSHKPLENISNNMYNIHGHIHDGIIYIGDNKINVAVEGWDYTPVTIYQIEEIINA